MSPSLSPALTPSLPDVDRPSLAEQAFSLMGRIARSGIWISSHVGALQSQSICRRWSDVLAYLREHSVFLHVACDACALPFSRAVARWQFVSIGQTAGVRGYRQFVRAAFANGRGPAGQRRLFLARAELSIKDGDDEVLDADPIPLAYQYADARIANAEYRQRTASRLAAIFRELGIGRLGDVQPGLLLPFFDKEVAEFRMEASTANAYRTAIWQFCRWLVKDRKFYSFGRALAELDVQGVRQTAMVRGKRQQRRAAKGGATNG